MATLTFAVTADTPVWVLSSGSGVVVDTILVCEDEQARVVELIPGDGNAFRVQRGYNGTGSAAHTAGSTVTVESEAESIPDLIVPIPPIDGGGGGIDVPDGWSWDTQTLEGEAATQPTFAQVLAAHPEITPSWAATSDLSYSDDCVVLVNGGGKAFITEYFAGDLTGGSEPDWPSAPNAGDTVSDGDITWIATAKTWATALATTPTTWTANHDYSPDVSSPVLIWPMTPTGNLYLAYPVPLTSDSSEPDFGTTFGDFTSDNDGYWMDAGGAPAKSIEVDDVTAREAVLTPSLQFSTAAAFNLNFVDDSGFLPVIHGGVTIATTDGQTTGFELFTVFDPAGTRTVDSLGAGVYTEFLGGTFPLVSDDFPDAMWLGFAASNSTFPQGVVGLYLNTFSSNSTGTFLRPLYINTTLSGTTAFDELEAVWIEDLATSKATNVYYEWFDSRGVRRVREDATFNSVGQAIEALYNPQFTKYTAGAANFERIILGQWNSNVAEIGNEKGGTGVLRDLRFIGQDIKPNPTGYFYLHEAVVTAAPASGDCDAAGETNRIVYDSTNDNLYVCSGSSGWRKITTGAP